MSLKCFILLFVLSVRFSSGLFVSPLQIIYEWNLLEFQFPTQADKDEAISSGNFVPQNAIPIDVALSPDESKIFVTIPRLLPGVPYTLATINPNGLSGPNGPLLQPYPSYDWNNKYNKSCDGFVSVFRVAITECNQMWVLDTGLLGETQYCPPQLWLFDLASDEVIHRYQFENDVYTASSSVFITPIAYVKSTDWNCQQTLLYIADVENHGLVIYDYAQDRAWRAESKWMYPDPDYDTFTIAGESFTLMDGIFGLTTDKRNLYFHALASLNEISVPLSVVNDPSNFANGVDAQESSFRVLGSRERACATEAIDSKNNIYCVTFDPISLISWNTNSSSYSQSVFTEIPIDPTLLEFVSGMKVVKQRDCKEYLWMMSNRFQKFALGTLNENEIHFRITRLALEGV